jgi:hypothetical protein
MSGYVEKFEESRQEREGLRTIPGPFRDKYPALALCMGGILDEEGARVRLSAASVTLFWEGEQLKFAVSPRFDNKVAFGTVADPLQALASIDRAISEGQIGWKTGRRQKGS